MSHFWIRRLIRSFSATTPRAARPATRRRPRTFLPGLERLEHRDLPAFLAPVSYTAGAGPAGIAVGDFNGDGRDDMAVVNQTVAGTITVLQSNSAGGFLPGVSYAVGAGPVDATAGDLNGDGKLDLVVVGSSSVTVLLGNGDGTFGAPTTYAAAAPHSVRLGDFNNDGKLDVATVSGSFTGGGLASVFLGNGDGTLQARIDTAMPGNNINVVVGDYNHDGNLDLAASNTTSVGTISVLHGHGDGTFDAPVSYGAFSAPVYLAKGDFNHDGWDDFIVPNSYAQTSMSVIMSDGHGGFLPPHTLGIAETGQEAEVADFNHDGNDDIAVRGANEYMVHYGKGDGTFYPEVDFPTTSGAFEHGTHGDFNGDGAIDLAYPSFTGVVTVVANDNADLANLAGAVTFQVAAPATTTSGSVLPMTITAVDATGNVATGFRGTVYISSSDPAATTAAGYAFNPIDAGIPYTFTAADVGAHTFTGPIRLVTGGAQTVTASAPFLTPATVTVDVTGKVTNLAFTAPTATNAGDSFNVSVSAVDVLGVVATGYTSTVHFTSSDALAGLPADYTFTPADAGTHTFTVTLKRSGPQSIVAQEVGGTISGSTTVTVTPLAAQSLALAIGSGPVGFFRPLSVVARDTYGNVATSYTGTVHVTSSDPAAVLPPDTKLVNGVAMVNVKLMTVGTQTITATDVAAPTLIGTVSSNATPPIPTTFAVSGYPATTAGFSNTFTVTVHDSIGQVATGYTGTVFFSSTDVQAGLPASYTFTAADAGVHTFSATFRTAGTQTLWARDSAGLIGSEAGIAVSPAAFASLRVTTPIANPQGMLVTADAVVPIVVQALDVFGNTVTSYAGTVVFTSTDSLATLPAAYRFAGADAGVHIFNVGLHTATKTGQSWSVSVADAASPTASGTVPGFEVINGAAAVIIPTLPTQITAGAAFTSRVVVNDAWGNGVQNYFGTVHFSTSAALAGLPADYTFTGADAGVHTFTLTLDTGGNQTLTVTDVNNPSLSGSVSGAVKAAAASSVVVAFPATTTSGAAQPLTVTALDTYGNVATGYTGTVTFSSSDAQASLPAAYTFTTKDAGVHTFTATLRTPGSQSVTVQDSAHGFSATQSGIAVAPPAPVVVASLSLSGFPATTAGVAHTFTVTARDASGNVVTGYTGTVTFSSSDVQAGLPASYTFTAADAGAHTFTATLKTAGSRSITVTDAANAALVASQTGIAVSAAAAARFLFSGPSSVTQGVGFKFTLTVVDAYGNVATGYRGKVHLSSSDPRAGTQDYTFSNNDNGVHIFSYTLNALGLQTLTLMDSSNNALAGSFNVNVLAK